MILFNVLENFDNNKLSGLYSKGASTLPHVIISTRVLYQLKTSSCDYEIAGQALKCLNMELEQALVAIQKCLNLLHDDLGPK